MTWQFRSLRRTVTGTFRVIYKQSDSESVKSVRMIELRPSGELVKTEPPHRPAPDELIERAEALVTSDELQSLL